MTKIEMLCIVLAVALPCIGLVAYFLGQLNGRERTLNDRKFYEDDKYFRDTFD